MNPLYSRLASKLAHLFPPSVRDRGKNYYDRGAVRIERGSALAVEALVRGSQVYEVELALEDGDLWLDCDCPYFESNGPCKHQWATVLAAQARGYLSSVSAQQKVMGIGFDDLDDDPDAGLTLVRRPVAPAAPK